MDFVRAIETIADFLEEHDCRYALIGGLALAAYGHPRTTLDIDLLVEHAEQDRIIGFMESLGFETLYRSQGYSNHAHSSPDWGRVDFVYVDQTTGDEVFLASREVLAPGGRRIPVPKAEHLIAMKVLAMKNDPARMFQELADIRNLLTKPGADREVVRSYFKKHDLEDRYDELERTL